MDLSKLRIESLTKVAYGCFIQQLMVICKYFRGEYWRLFIGIEFVEEYEANKKIYKVKKNFVDRLKDQYGIELVDCNQTISFSSDEIYFAAISAKDFPLYVSSIENEVDHYFIIYGEQNDSYIIHDNYYDVTEYYVKKSIIEEKVKEVYKIEGIKDWKSEKTSILDYYLPLKNIEPNWEKLIEYYSNIIETESLNFLSCVKNISEYLGMTACVFEEFCNQSKDKYMEYCGGFLKKNATDISEMYYAFLKEWLKNKKIRDGYYSKKSKDLSKKLTNDKRIKEEIMHCFMGEESLYEKNKNILEKFLENKINEEKKLKDDLIDSYMLLAIISNYEMECNRIDMDLTNFDVNDSYKELILKVCKSMLIE